MTGTPYSPRLRTGVILCGAGTAGAYQAGAVRGLIEAGVKIDVLAAHGPGVITALATAIDGGARLWDPAGPWSSARLRRAYRWRRALRVAAIGLAAIVAALLVPLVVLSGAAVVYAASMAAALMSLTRTSTALVGVYQRAVEILFSPPILPTILPRAALLGILIVAGVLVASALRASRHARSRRRFTGAFWWHLFGSPFDATEPGATVVDTLWGLVRGASNEPKPTAAEIGRRYVDLLADNFGQPGFREVILAVHDLDSRRDLIGAVLPSSARAAFEARRAPADPREAEGLDLTGPHRELVVPMLLGAMRLPVVTEPIVIQFPSESFWRGERHRVCDRPELTVRLVEELAAIGVEQVVLVSSAPQPAVPHAMRARPAGIRARVGEFVRSIEASALHDGVAAATARFSGVFVIRPDHNPVGPFDFAGAYDEASDRERTVAELIQQGYADAYRHFIEPVVAAGEHVET